MAHQLLCDHPLPPIPPPRPPPDSPRRFLRLTFCAQKRMLRSSELEIIIHTPELQKLHSPSKRTTALSVFSKTACSTPPLTCASPQNQLCISKTRWVQKRSREWRCVGCIECLASCCCGLCYGWVFERSVEAAILCRVTCPTLPEHGSGFATSPLDVDGFRNESA